MSVAGRLVLVLVLVLVLMGFGAIYRQIMSPKINPTVYTPLLNTIAKGESNGNYNAYFGHADNNDIQFTAMTVEQVMQWQQSFITQGNASSAVGKYQIISTTLAGLVQRLDIDKQAVFNETLQDKLAVALLEKRGATDYMEQKLTPQQFAANLAQEWAALPKATGDSPEQSYYAGDGINKVQISVDEMYKVLATIRASYRSL